jgi:hypothetical protein
MTVKDVNEVILVAKRGYAIADGPTSTLSIFFRDDVGEVHCKVGRFKFAKMGKPMQERGKAGKALYAIRGNLRRFGDGFLSIDVQAAWYLGDLA